MDDAKLVRVEAAEEVVRVERARVEANRGGDHDRELLSKSWCPFAANVEEQLLGLVERRCPHRRGVAHMVEAELTPVGEARRPSLLTDYFVLGGFWLATDWVKYGSIKGCRASRFSVSLNGLAAVR